MVCKKLDEDDIRSLFEKFGTIEECTILRDNNGISKGKYYTVSNFNGFIEVQW